MKGFEGRENFGLFYSPAQMMNSFVNSFSSDFHIEQPVNERRKKSNKLFYSILF